MQADIILLESEGVIAKNYSIRSKVQSWIKNNRPELFLQISSCFSPFFKGSCYCYDSAILNLDELVRTY